MFSTNTIAKLAGINNFVLNEATTSVSKYTDEQIIDLLKKVELGIRQNDELFALNKKRFGGVDKTAEETAEEDQKKQEEADKEANKENAARDEEKAAASYEELKKNVKNYFVDERNYEQKTELAAFKNYCKGKIEQIIKIENGLDLRPYMSSWIEIGDEFTVLRKIIIKVFVEMHNYLQSKNDKFNSKNFGDYVNSFFKNTEIKQIVYEKTIKDKKNIPTALVNWTWYNNDKPIIEVVNENKELIKLIIKRADEFASQPIPATITDSTTFISRVFTIFTRPSDNIKIRGCKFIDALEHANKGKNKIFIWNQGVYSAVSLDDTINLSVILKGLTKKTLKQLSNIALRSYGREDLSTFKKDELDKLNESLFDTDLENDVLNEAWSLKARKITVDSLHKAWSEEGRPKTPAAFKEFIEDHLIIQFGEKHSRKISELLSKVLKAPEQSAPTKDEENKKDDVETDTSKPEDDEPLLKPEEDDEEDDEEETPSAEELTPEQKEADLLHKFGISKQQYNLLSKLVKDYNNGILNREYWKTPANRNLYASIIKSAFHHEGHDITAPLHEHNIHSIEDLDKAIITEQQCKLAGIKSPFNSQKFFEDLDKVLQQFS